MTSTQSCCFPYTTGEIFCGAGGMSRGFHDIGFQTRFANDVWPTALHNFMMNFDRRYACSLGRESEKVLALSGSVEQIEADFILSRMQEDRSDGKIEVGDLDVLLGGPPCQGFSLNSHTRNAEDPRNHLFRHYVRLLKDIAPKIFVLENVPGMLSLDGGRFFEELIEAISAKQLGLFPGYSVDFKILNAAHYGVPQERFRIVVVGTRHDVAKDGGKVTLPSPMHYSRARAHFKGGRSATFHYAIGHDDIETDKVSRLFSNELLRPVSVKESIGDLPELSNGSGTDSLTPYEEFGIPLTAFQERMRFGSDGVANHWCRGLFFPNTERVKHIPQGGDWRSIPRDLLPPGMKLALRKDHTTRYGRLAPNNLSGTLLTKPDPHWGTFIHYDERQQRLISVREAARLQSFPDCHRFYGGQVDQYKLIGNAVPPLMAQSIAREIGLVLDNLYGRRCESRSCDVDSKTLRVS